MLHLSILRVSVDLSRDVLSGDSRTPDQLREHYEIEKELATRLRSASPDVRRELYHTVYDELFTRVPLHPQLASKADPSAGAVSVYRKMGMLAPFLNSGHTFLEVGAGDCALSAAVSRRVRKVYAVDVSEEIVRGLSLPDNVEIRLSEGTEIPVPRESVDVAYSDQLMEHLHPDDALEQVRNIYAALVPGGVYVCVTPNRVTGPHDISKYFDDVASGFHLKEYTISELRRLFSRVGFTNIVVLVGGRGRFFRVPPLVAEVFEKIIGVLPAGARRNLAARFRVHFVLGIRIVGRK